MTEVDKPPAQPSSNQCTHFQKVGPGIVQTAVANIWECPWCKVERLEAGLRRIGELSASFRPVAERLLSGERIEQIAGSPSSAETSTDRRTVHEKARDAFAEVVRVAHYTQIAFNAMIEAMRGTPCTDSPVKASVSPRQHIVKQNGAHAVGCPGCSPVNGSSQAAISNKGST